MSKHVREFPGASFDHWLTTNPADAELGPDPHEETEPELVECDMCSKYFEPDHDNEHRGSNGALYFCCDKCMSFGLHTREGRR